MNGRELCWTLDRGRFFWVPVSSGLPAGFLKIATASASTLDVDAEAVRMFEISEKVALDIATIEAGESLAAIKLGIDAELARVRKRLERAETMAGLTGQSRKLAALSAVVDLAACLPRVIVQSLSHDTGRIDLAKDSMNRLRVRLADAGIVTDSRVTQFPARLAELRETFDRERKPK